MVHLIKDIASLVFYGCTRHFFDPRDKELVLAYHSVGGNWPGDKYKMDISRSCFERQIGCLPRLKFKRLIITFDDGFDNFFNLAFPVISKYNNKVIIFITTGFIDKDVPSSVFYPGLIANPLSWSQIREISDAGVEIGSHTITHPKLPCLDKKKAYIEISDSKKIIEDRIGKEVKSFAYPYGSRGSFNDSIKSMVVSAGYERAYANIMGFNAPDSDSFELKRVRVYDDDNIFRFKMKVRGAYNWVDRFLKQPFS